MPEREHRLILSWDTLLFLALTSAHFWFNQVSSAFLVIALAIYLILDLLYPQMGDEKKFPDSKDRYLFLTRLVLVIFAVMTAAILPTGYSMLKRKSLGPATNAQDGLIQTEIAIEFLLDGKNPYVETYENTPLAEWQGGEPPFTYIPGPLHHNVYLPFLFIGSIPFYLLSHQLLGWYDQRLLYLLLYFATLLLTPILVKKQRDQLTLIMLIGLNFLFIFFLAEGRNDIAILFGLVLSTVLLIKKRLRTSLFILGLTLTIKHQAWFFLPFYLLYIRPQELTFDSIKRWLISLWPLYLAGLLVVGPFLLWDAPAFFSDTVGYITGMSEYSFPIRGIGFSHILVAIGIIPDYDASFPSIIFSLLFAIPATIYALRRQSRVNSLSNMWFGFVALAFTFQFFSRFFNDNYFIFITQSLFIAQFIKPELWEPTE